MNFSIHYSTANVDNNLFRNIKYISDKYGLKPECILKDLIKLSCINLKTNKSGNALTEYQDHGPDKWVNMKYSLDAVEIEFFGEARLKLKLSVSKLAFIGFILYWDLLMFTYKMRYKIIKFQYNSDSYLRYQKKFRYLLKIFVKRFEIIQKE